MDNFGRKELESLIFEKFNIQELTSLINSQITRFVGQHGYSYKDIARALVFFTEVEKGKLDTRFGIGIVPNVMKEAQNYFKTLKEKKEEQLKNYEKNKQDNIILVAKPKKRKINFSIKKESEE